MDSKLRHSAILNSQTPAAPTRGLLGELSRLSLWLEDVPLPAALLNRTGHLLFVNEAWSRWLCGNKDFYLHRHITELLCGDNERGLESVALLPAIGIPVQKLAVTLQDQAGIRYACEYSA